MTECDTCGRRADEEPGRFCEAPDGDGRVCTGQFVAAAPLGDRPRTRIPEHWDRTHWREIRDGAYRRERRNRMLFAVLWPIIRVVGAIDRRLRWAEVRDQDWRRPRPPWRVWLTPKVSAVHEALQHFAARRVF